MSYQQEISTVGDVCSRAGDTWKDISPEYAARMRLQNRFRPASTSPVTRRRSCAGHGRVRRGYESVHAVARLLARLHRSAEDDRDQEALRRHEQALPVPVRLDGRGPAQRVRPAAGPVHAREDLRTRPDRRALHVPAPGRCPRARWLFRELDAARDAGDEVAAKAIENSIDNFTDPRRADHRRHRRRLRQRGGHLPAGQEDDRGGRLRDPDREPGLRREAVRPPGRQGHRAARGFPRQDSRRAATPSSSSASRTASSWRGPIPWAPA
jgi:hypothetical protein